VTIKVHLLGVGYGQQYPREPVDEPHSQWNIWGYVRVGRGPHGRLCIRNKIGNVVKTRPTNNLHMLHNTLADNSPLLPVYIVPVQQLLKGCVAVSCLLLLISSCLHNVIWASSNKKSCTFAVTVLFDSTAALCRYFSVTDQSSLWHTASSDQSNTAGKHSRSSEW